MDYHELLKLAGGALALYLFVPLVGGVLRDGGVGQSFSTWLLWAALDWVSTISVILQHGNYYILLGFACGSTVMTFALLARRRYGWGRFDNFVLVLVGACLVAWWLGGPQTATVASALGICVAGIPGLLALWRQPDRKLARLWGWYTLANGLAFLGGTAMTVEERFSPGAFTVFSLALTLAGCRRRK